MEDAHPVMPSLIQGHRSRVRRVVECGCLAIMAMSCPVVSRVLLEALKAFGSDLSREAHDSYRPFEDPPVFVAYPYVWE